MDNNGFVVSPSKRGNSRDQRCRRRSWNLEITKDTRFVRLVYLNKVQLASINLMYLITFLNSDRFLEIHPGLLELER